MCVPWAAVTRGHRLKIIRKKTYSLEVLEVISLKSRSQGYTPSTGSRGGSALPLPSSGLPVILGLWPHPSASNVTWFLPSVCISSSVS